MKNSFSSEPKSKLDHKDDEVQEKKEIEVSVTDNGIEVLKDEKMYSKQLKLRLPSHLNKEINDKQKFNSGLLKSVEAHKQINNSIEESRKKKFKFNMKLNSSTSKGTSKQLTNVALSNLSNKTLGIIKDSETKLPTDHGTSKLHHSSTKSKVKFDSSAKLNLKKSIMISSISKTNIGKVLKKTLFQTDRSSKDILSISGQSSSGFTHGKEKSEVSRKRIKDIVSSYSNSIAILKNLEQYQSSCFSIHRSFMFGNSFKSKHDLKQEELKKEFDTKALNLLTDDIDSQCSSINNNSFPKRLHKILKDPTYVSFNEFPHKRLISSQKFFSTLEKLYGAAVGSKFKKKIYTLCLKDLVRTKNMNFLTVPADPLKSYLKKQKEENESKYKLRFFNQY